MVWECFPEHWADDCTRGILNEHSYHCNIIPTTGKEEETWYQVSEEHYCRKNAPSLFRWYISKKPLL